MASGVMSWRGSMRAVLIRPIYVVFWITSAVIAGTAFQFLSR
jgi:hypothetical protein